jgi:hypothetical protein
MPATRLRQAPAILFTTKDTKVARRSFLRFAQNKLRAPLVSFVSLVVNRGETQIAVVAAAR